VYFSGEVSHKTRDFTLKTTNLKSPTSIVW
jgi:hypothetical protein